MKSASLPSRALIGAGIFGLAEALRLRIGYLDDGPLSIHSVLQESLILVLYLGWLGIGELARLGKHRQVRSIQLTVLALAAPSLFYPSGVSQLGLWGLAAVMLLAFGMALRRPSA